MEKFFIVTEKSALHKDYFDYTNNIKTVSEYAKQFMNKHNISTTEYSCSSEVFYIVPNNKDIKNFNKVLGEKLRNGLRPFKKRSEINKDWIAFVKQNNIEILGKPFVGRYFDNIIGKHKYRIFIEDYILYCSMESNTEIDIPCGFEEIKGSEFYKVLENN